MMTIRECYDKIGSDFDAVLGRLYSEALISKFAVRFLDDPSFGELTSAHAEGRVQDAFRAAHTLKGVCLNLGFDRLYEVSSALTEMLRGGVMDGSDDMLRQVEERYNQTVAVLREFKG